MDFEIVSNSAEETIAIGRRFGEQLRGGEVVGISGKLGSGKTHLIKGVAAGAGAEDAGHSVTSPTFVIVNEYSGRFDIYHIDAYRLESLEDFERLGFDDYCYPGSIVLIEWADKIEAALKGVNYIKIKLFHYKETARKIHIDNVPGYAAM